MLKSLVKKIFNSITINHYYLMSDAALEDEARKWQIGRYVVGDGGPINRRSIIEQLIEKDNANNSKYAILISIFALVISIFALIN